MKENLKDILSNLSPDVDQETLLLYLQGMLSAEQQHEVEKKMMENDFASDALEGLHNIKDRQRMQQLIEQLHYDLKKKTEKKKAFKEKRRIKQDPWILVAIVLILTLVIIAYFVIRQYMQ